MSQLASTIAATASGLRSSAMATPKMVTGMPRPAKRRCRRQKPTRLPYSYIDSIGRSRCPTRAVTKPNSVRRDSDDGSPWRIEFSAPSS